MWFWLSPQVSTLLSRDFLCNVIDWCMSVTISVALFKHCNHYGHSKQALGNLTQWAKLTTIVKGQIISDGVRVRNPALIEYLPLIGFFETC